MTTPIKLRIIHETNPRKYFPAIYELAKDGSIELVGEHRYSVFKEWVRSWLRDKTGLVQRSKNALGDFLLRFKLPFIKGETIIIGFAPWDWRILLYRVLAKRNKILYQTSWHDWRINNTPRQPKPFFLKKKLQKVWHDFVKHPNVKVIAVTPVVAETVLNETGVKAQVIPHAVPNEFFEAGAAKKENNSQQLKLLYVGEISEKKGIKVLVNILNELNCDKISLTVVGNGPLVKLVESSPNNVTYLGPIYDRAKLAKVMSEHDVLMLLSQKTPTWEELFGIVIVEAIAAGCAVIASDHIGPRGILEQRDTNGLVAQNDEASVKALINTLLTEEGALDTLKAAQNVAESYSTESIKLNWFKAIQEL